VITYDFIHIHVPRTGGSLVRSLVQELLIDTGKTDVIDTDAHRTLRESRKMAGPDVPSFAFVRNPFDWYVSRYHRAIDMEVFDGTFEEYFNEIVVSGGGTITNVWDYFTSPGVDHIGRFERLVPEIVRIFGIVVPQLPSDDIIAKVNKLGKVRASKNRRSYHKYYDDDLVNMVLDLDWWYLKEFDYGYKNTRK